MVDAILFQLHALLKLLIRLSSAPYLVYQSSNFLIAPVAMATQAVEVA